MTICDHPPRNQCKVTPGSFSDYVISIKYMSWALKWDLVELHNIRYPEAELWSRWTLLLLDLCELDYYWILISSKNLQCATLHWVRHGRSHIWNHNEKYIQISTNMPGFDWFIHTWNSRLTFQKCQQFCWVKPIPVW